MFPFFFLSSVVTFIFKICVLCLANKNLEKEFGHYSKIISYAYIFYAFYKSEIFGKNMFAKDYNIS